MKIVMTLLVRDEQDILRTNLDFHLAQGVDSFIIMDHLSSDATPDILQEFKSAGVAEVLHQNSPAYHQSEWVTMMARRAATHYGADWVINNDADEFWWPTKGNLKTTLGTISNLYGAVSVGRTNFPPMAYANSDFLDEMVLRELFSRNSNGKPLPGKVCHVGNPRVRVSQGNHNVSGDNLDKIARTTDLEILHFPLRSFEQFERKIKNGGRAYQNSTGMPSSVGSTWRSLYAAYLRGELRDYYLFQCIQEEDIAAKIKDGLVVQDFRLRDYMKSLNSGI